MVKKWEDYELPESMVVNGREYKFRSDWRAVLNAIRPLSDPDLLQEEQVYCAASLFFLDFNGIRDNDLQESIEQMFLFVCGNKENNSKQNEPTLMDWKKDLNTIISPINKMVGRDIRLDKKIHWWTFLSWFSEIGESTFQTYVGIRYKRGKGKKLDDNEKEIYRKNKEDIDIVKQKDRTTQQLVDEVLRSLQYGN